MALAFLKRDIAVITKFISVCEGFFFWEQIPSIGMCSTLMSAGCINTL